MGVPPELQTLALGALLHDIGKFRERAGLPAPTVPPGARYSHEPHSYAFVQQFQHLFSDPQRIGDLVLKHHAPELPDEQVIAIGDRLAANERVDWEKEEAQAEPRGRSNRRLLAPFPRLFDQTLPQERAFALQPLSLERSILFPGNHTSGEQAYRQHWQQFETECQRLRTRDDVETWMALLQKYLWCVPASARAQEIPDVSLYDHARAVAAVAICARVQLGTDEERIQQLLQATTGSKEPLCLLARVDLSGIQDFLYTLTASGAGRSLRGRSFYLSLLAETVARWVLERLQLPITQLLYSGGGHAYLLLPACVEDTLCALRVEAECKMLALHNGDIRTVIAWAPVTPEEFGPEQFSERWREATQQADARKRAPLAGQDPAQFFQLFEPFERGGRLERCDVCQAELTGQEQADAEGTRKCRLCESFEELGRRLREADRFVLRAVAPAGNERVTHWRDGLRAFGMELHPRQGHTDVSPGDTVLMINRTDFLPAAAQEGVSYGFRWLTQVFPYDEHGDLLQFGPLAGQSRGVERLAALRMDVDNLGRLFKEGFGKEASLSRVASVSTLLRLFFEGYLNRLCQEEADWQGKLYGLYAGGDDLFFVGTWDIMPAVATKIQKEFQEFVCKNPCITVSAGIALFPPKYPLYQAAEDSKKALDERAKKHKRHSKETESKKNAIDFLEQTFGWEEWPDVCAWYRQLDDLLEQGMPAALLQRIRTLNAMRRQEEERQECRDAQERRPPSQRWRWMGVYTFARLVGQYKKFQSDLEQIRQQLQLENTEHARALERAALAARWVQLHRRDKTSD
ncbi:MAG: type III-A CRISPR-associated protein Cas10/Csm1 [Chloroherpetonaceae bacterium]|nr:type III-A CRISPR-associated protein Cas10/Csm1 [Chloroherpetonaceae bacterium]